MIKAPSEMRCSEMPKSFMATNVTASTSGMAMATTIPGRQPSARKLTSKTMAMASISVLVNSPTASFTTCGWSATRLSSMPTGKSAVSCAARALMFLPSASASPPAAMATARPSAGSPL
jgi:hypothetical protein